MSGDDPQGGSFLSRWSRRKAQARSGEPVAPGPLAPGAPPPPVAVHTQPAVAPPVVAPVDNAPVAVVPVVEAPSTGVVAPADEPAAPPPTLADVAALTRDADYSRFVGRGVAPDVRNAALKKLFTDPHYNVMDGLDTYIGDYNTPDPLPPGMLRKMVQSQLLGLFADEEPPAAPATAGSPPSLPEPMTPADENPAVQLQPDDDTRRPALKPGAGPDPRLQH